MSGAESVRPILFLDVDGVLNVYGGASPPPGFSEHGWFAGEEPVRLNSVHGRWIRELSRVMDVVWATGWNAEANRLLAPFLGLPALPVVGMPVGIFDPGDKVPRIDAFAGGRAAAWVDDLHAPAAWEWAAARRFPTLLVPADPAVGLTRVMVEGLLAWVAEVCPLG
ncbi:HAD domain-containing protein [Actinoplanes sp. HUAS TT8]|uniref:HAD domain-containing protein n=1 Tax=Actinoplanes sp. HUAS TT8 TaxID=3447453 RepID=UPI003F51FCCC